MSIAPRPPGIALEDIPTALQERLAPRLEQDGVLGEFFSRAAQQPDALGCYVDWTVAVEAALPPRMVASIALTIASRTGNDYVRMQHERCALAAGMSDDEIGAILSGNLNRTITISDEESAAAALSRCLVDGFGSRCTPALLRLSRLAGEPAAVACLMLAARHVAHAVMANAWGLRPPDPTTGPIAFGER